MNKINKFSAAIQEYKASENDFLDFETCQRYLHSCEQRLIPLLRSRINLLLTDGRITRLKDGTCIDIFSELVDETRTILCNEYLPNDFDETFIFDLIFNHCGDLLIDGRCTQ